MSYSKLHDLFLTLEFWRAETHFIHFATSFVASFVRLPCMEKMLNMSDWLNEEVE